VFTRSSKRRALALYFEYICWKFAGRLLDRVNIPLSSSATHDHDVLMRDVFEDSC